MEKEELKEEIKEVIKKDIEENGVVKNSDINKQTDEEKKKIRFEMGEICMTTCHPHEMKFMRSLAWTCDGAHLEQGCEYGKKIFRSDEARFRCSQCDFDLCDKCIVRYVI